MAWSLCYLGILTLRVAHIALGLVARSKHFDLLANFELIFGLVHGSALSLDENFLDDVVERLLIVIGVVLRTLESLALHVEILEMMVADGVVFGCFVGAVVDLDSFLIHL